MVFDFESYPLWLNALVFAVSSGVIWAAGVRLERYADAIAGRTSLGHAFTGMLLLSAATSLPELATTITAVVLLNNPTLAVYNLLGGVAMQTGILIVADRASPSGALTFFSPKFVLLIEGVGLLILLQITIAGVTARGMPAVASIGLWPVLLMGAYVVVMYLTYRYRKQARWSPMNQPDEPDDESESPEQEANDTETDSQEQSESDNLSHSTFKIWLLFALASLVVLVGGWTTASTADVLAEQTGLGPVFLGATLLAIATSLPELSTTIAASRSGRYSMAISNVFGSNAFDVTLLFLADLLYRGGSILEEAEGSLAFVAAIGSLMTCCYLWGLLEREDRSVFGIGWDSAAALVLYVGGMTVLYFIS